MSFTWMCIVSSRLAPARAAAERTRVGVRVKELARRQFPDAEILLRGVTPADPRPIVDGTSTAAEVWHADSLQDPHAGRVLRIAAREQAPDGRAHDPARVPTRGGRADEQRRLPRAHAGQGARGAGRNRLARAA